MSAGAAIVNLRRMNIEALRLWGIAVSASLMAAALFVASRPAALEAHAQTEPVAAAAPPTARHVGFIVRFRGDGPIARAQARASGGGEAPAQREIEAQLIRQAAFNGLCFDRFTVGASEVVLRSCEVMPAREAAGYQQVWLARLQAMRAVAYADANASVSAEQR